ncbi:MAG: signal recognition particle receptor subunit alpha [Nitrosomonas sp.]|nr:signal recognition particle receptor subunit alpha [Nitrosomonas sp.]
MFDNLTERFSGVIKTLRGEARLTESNIQDALREVRMALIEADVALPVIKIFIEQVKQRAIGHEVILDKLSPARHSSVLFMRSWSPSWAATKRNSI